MGGLGAGYANEKPVKDALGLVILGLLRAPARKAGFDGAHDTGQDQRDRHEHDQAGEHHIDLNILDIVDRVWAQKDRFIRWPEAIPSFRQEIASRSLS